MHLRLLFFAWTSHGLVHGVKLNAGGRHAVHLSLLHAVHTPKAHATRR